MMPDADFEQNERVRDRFTRTADAFAQLAVPPRAVEAEKIVQLAQARPEDVGLDLACGPGTFATALARRARRVFGVDLTPAFLRLARKRAVAQGLANIRFLCGDATALPLPDESIDVAVCGYSFHHMREPQRALRELARVVRRGGRLAVVDLYTPEGFDPEAADRIERARDISHRRTFTRDEFLRTVERAGFTVDATETLERSRRFSEWMRIAGWNLDDPAWRESRRLMEAHLSNDETGFQPLLMTDPGPDDPEPEIQFTQRSLFLGATKS